MSGSSNGFHRRSVRIPDGVDLHARPAGLLVRAAAQQSAAITLHANGRDADFRIGNFLGFFADHVSGNQIYGVITNIVGVVDPTAGPAPANIFPMAIRLVE